MNAVKLKTYTWGKDSHKLFDYECSNLHQSEVTSSESLIVTRGNNQVTFHDPSIGGIPADQTLLCSLKKTSDGYPAAPLKLVIRSLKSEGKQNGYELKVGDKIQIGRVEFFVREIRNSENNLFKADYSAHANQTNDMDIEEPQESKFCRICLEEEETNGASEPGKMFISPCSCKGSSKHVHIDCLKSWVKCKKLENRRNGNQFSSQSSLMGLIYYLSSNEANYITRLTHQPHFRALLSNWYSGQPETTGALSRTSNLNSQFAIPLSNVEGSNTNIPEGPFLNDVVPESNLGQPNHAERAYSARNDRNVENNFFSNFACDVCKEILPFSVKTNDQLETEITNIVRPEGVPYMILEKLSQGKESKVFSVIKGIENFAIQLGRGHNCDVPIPDISVSRCHAIIRYQEGKFMMFDNSSKFGTLVLLKGDIEVQKDKLGFQCGRTLITVSTKVNKQSRQSEDIAKIEEITSSNAEKSYIRRSGYYTKTRRIDKRVQSEMKIPLKNKPKDDKNKTIEEVSLRRFSDLSPRSKKISKRN